MEVAISLMIGTTAWNLADNLCRTIERKEPSVTEAAIALKGIGPRWIRGAMEWGREARKHISLISTIISFGSLLSSGLNGFHFRPSSSLCMPTVLPPLVVDAVSCPFRFLLARRTGACTHLQALFVVNVRRLFEHGFARAICDGFAAVA